MTPQKTGEFHNKMCISSLFCFPNHVWLPSYLLFNVPVWSAILVIIIIIMRYNTVYTFCKSSPSDYF